MSSFAHFIECAAKQNVNIGLMPVALFSPVYLFQGFLFLMILVSCCSVVFLPRNYLFHNPFSLFLPLSFYSAAMFRCQSAVILMCVLLFITVLIFPLSAEYFCFA